MGSMFANIGVKIVTMSFTQTKNGYDLSHAAAIGALIMTILVIGG